MSQVVILAQHSWRRSRARSIVLLHSGAPRGGSSRVYAAPSRIPTDDGDSAQEPFEEVKDVVWRARPS
jgi:hypothetical protein